MIFRTGHSPCPTRISGPPSMRASWQPAQLEEQDGSAVHVLCIDVDESLSSDTHDGEQAKRSFGGYRHAQGRTIAPSVVG
jgi:hypothetical protein